MTAKTKKTQKKQTPQQKKKMAVKASKPKLRVAVPGAYVSAVSHPFSRLALGARIPDGNPLTLATVMLTQKVQLQSDGSGILDATILPNIVTSLISTRASNSGGELLYVADTATTAGLHPATTATARGHGFDVNALSGLYTSYRIVAMGARLRSIASTASTGEFMLAVHPLRGYTFQRQNATVGVTDPAGLTVLVPSYTDAAGPRSTVELMLNALGLPYSGSGNSATVDVTKIVQMPNHAVVSQAEVAARGMHCRSCPFESYAREFRRVTFNAVGANAVDVAVAEVGANGQSYSVDMDALRVGGNESIVIGGSGFAANSVVGTVEMVYHLEVVPNPNVASLTRPTSALVKAPPTNYDQHVHRVSQFPRLSFADVVAQAGDALLGDVEGRVTQAVGSSVGGVITRLLALGV